MCWKFKLPNHSPSAKGAMEGLRQTHLELTLKLNDMSPKEQIDAPKAGDIDVALTGQEGVIASRDFHSLKLRSLGVCAALAFIDPLAGTKRLALKDLRERRQISVKKPSHQTLTLQPTRLQGLKGEPESEPRRFHSPSAHPFIEPPSFSKGLGGHALLHDVGRGKAVAQSLCAQSNNYGRLVAKTPGKILLRILRPGGGGRPL